MASEFDYDVALDAAVDAAKAASEVLMARFRPPANAPLEISYKGHVDPVTDADLAADRAVAEVLKARGVPGNILSEESEERRDVSGYTWLIDPLCGTVPFSTGLPHFGVNIALAHGLQLDIGVVALPATGEMLTAVRGRGAFLNGEPLVVEEPRGTHWTSPSRLVTRAPTRAGRWRSPMQPASTTASAQPHTPWPR